MALKKILLIIASIFFVSISLANEKLFYELRNQTNLKKNDILVVVYMNPSNCVKCYIEPISLIDYTESKKKTFNFKYIALVKCDREIELKSFKENTGWKYYLNLDNGNARKKLRSAPNSIMSFINYKGKILLNIKSLGYSKNTKLIDNMLSELK